MLFLEHGFRYVAKWNTLLLPFSVTSLIVFAAFLWITYVPIITNIVNSHILFYCNYTCLWRNTWMLWNFLCVSRQHVGRAGERYGRQFVLPDSQLRDRSRGCVRHPGPAGRRWRHRGIRSPENRHDHFLCLLRIPVLAGVNCFMFNNVPHLSLQITCLFCNCNPELNPLLHQICTWNRKPQIKDASNIDSYASKYKLFHIYYVATSPTFTTASTATVTPLTRWRTPTPPSIHTTLAHWWVNPLLLLLFFFFFFLLLLLNPLLLLGNPLLLLLLLLLLLFVVDVFDVSKLYISFLIGIWPL